MAGGEENPGASAQGCQKSTCEECGGATICEHISQRSQCKQCAGSQICEHDHRRYAAGASARSVWGRTSAPASAASAECDSSHTKADVTQSGRAKSAQDMSKLFPDIHTSGDVVRKPFSSVYNHVYISYSVTGDGLGVLLVESSVTLHLVPVAVTGWQRCGDRVARLIDVTTPLDSVSASSTGMQKLRRLCVCVVAQHALRVGWRTPVPFRLV